MFRRLIFSIPDALVPVLHIFIFMNKTSDNSCVSTFISTCTGKKVTNKSVKFVIDQGGLPMYIATRGLYNLKPPTVFVPPCIKDDVEEMLQIHRRMSRIDLEVELVALDLGMEIMSPLSFRFSPWSHLIVQ
jgi:hypothetical protein